MSDAVGINNRVFGGDVCDGSVIGGATVNSDFTMAAGAYKTFDLTDILPNDQYDYMCYFEAKLTTGTTSGNTASMLLYDGKLNADTIGTHGSWYTSLGRAITRTSNSTVNRITTGIPIRNDRAITVRNHDGSGTSGSLGLWLKSYRRISTNEKRKYQTNKINDENIRGSFIPGSWVSAGITAINNQNIGASLFKNVSLLSYLPNDGKTYEIYGTVVAHTGSTSGNSVVIRVGTANDNSGGCICGNVTRASGDMICAGTFTLFANCYDQIYVRNDGNATSGAVSLYLRAYRKLNTQRNITGVDTISIPTKDNFANVIQWGQASIVGSIASNFTSNNFLEIPIDKSNFTSNDSFDIHFKFKTGSLITDSDADNYLQYIVNSFNFSEISIQGNRLYTYNYSESSRTVLDFSIAANTDYVYNISLTPITSSTANYRVSASLTNVNTGVTTTHEPISDMLEINNSIPAIIGTHSQMANRSGNFLGSVDLSESYIKKNNKIIWQGIDKKRYVSIGGQFTDGIFTYKSKAVFTGTTFTAGSTITYTISDYLPNDGNDYEIYWRAYGRTVNTSGSACTISLESVSNAKFANQPLSYCRTRTASAHIDSLSGKFVTKGASFTMNVKQTNTSYNTGSCGLHLIGYRRVV